MGYYEGDRLRYAGKVGTGFDHATLARASATRSSAWSARRPRSPTTACGAARRWVEPELVAQIGFTEWTRDGKLRHPRYLGLRDDKPAREVVREEPS